MFGAASRGGGGGPGGGGGGAECVHGSSLAPGVLGATDSHFYSYFVWAVSAEREFIRHKIEIPI